MKFSSTNQSIVYLLAMAILSVNAAADDVLEGERKLQTQPKIVGGKDADPGEYPYYTLTVPGCGGALISPKVVLTAAHCTSPNAYYGVGSTIHVGITYRDSLSNGSGVKNGKAITVTKKKNHPDYNSENQDNDFALYELEEAYEIKSDVKLVLNEKADEPSKGTVLTAIGLGVTSQGGSVATTLQEVDLPAFSNKKCAKYIDYYEYQVRDSMFCAGFLEGGKDTCQADSGGPIVKKDGNTHYHMGITSWGFGCAQPDSPGVYARTSVAIDWIKSVVCDDWGHSESDICCSDNSDWLYKDKNGKDCDWVAAKNKRRKKLCKKNKVKKNCAKACNKC